MIETVCCARGGEGDARSQVRADERTETRRRRDLLSRRVQKQAARSRDFVHTRFARLHVPDDDGRRRDPLFDRARVELDHDDVYYEAHSHDTTSDDKEDNLRGTELQRLGRTAPRCIGTRLRILGQARLSGAQ